MTVIVKRKPWLNFSHRKKTWPRRFVPIAPDHFVSAIRTYEKLFLAWLAARNSKKRDLEVLDKKRPGESVLIASTRIETYTPVLE